MRADKNQHGETSRSCKSAVSNQRDTCFKVNIQLRNKSFNGDGLILRNLETKNGFDVALSKHRKYLIERTNKTPPQRERSARLSIDSLVSRSSARSTQPD